MWWVAIGNRNGVDYRQDFLQFPWAHVGLWARSGYRIITKYTDGSYLFLNEKGHEIKLSQQKEVFG